MSNTFGHTFRVTTWGESHGKAVGVLIDGCPSNISLSEADIQKALDRRRPGQSDLTTPRQEEDRGEILSGVFEGKTLGTPISLLIQNRDKRSRDYQDIKKKYRPSHADYTYEAKYGIRDWRGGGRASARETAARVAAGAVAQQVLRQRVEHLEVIAYIKTLHTLEGKVNPETITQESVESHALRAGDMDLVEPMCALIKKMQAEGNSVGGVIECVVRGCPPGWGSPVMDKLEAQLAKAMLSLPASKGFEIGSGFAGTKMTGAEHNDAFAVDTQGDIVTSTNHSGGIQGGITNGQPLLFRVAFKPTATIRQEQNTVTVDKEETTLSVEGRHDPCVLPRAVPIVEAMTLLVLCDEMLRQRVQK